MYHGYSKVDVKNEKDGLVSLILGSLLFTLPFVLIALPLLLYSCPYSSGISM